MLQVAEPSVPAILGIGVIFVILGIFCEMMSDKKGWEKKIKEKEPR